MDESAELIKETEWSRRYSTSQRSVWYESKFLVDGLEINADQLASRWESLSRSERHDFALAFQCKGNLSDNDERILLFLMREGDEIVWRTISRMLCRHSDRESVTRFLLLRLQGCSEGRSNYYQAAEEIADKRFIPALERHFFDYLTRYAVDREGMQVRDWLEYLQLCYSLSRMTGKPEYERAMKELSDHSSEVVRARAHDYLKSL